MRLLFNLFGTLSMTFLFILRWITLGKQEIKTTEIIIFNQKIHEMETLYIINLVDGIDPVFSLSLIRTEHPGI